MKEYMKEYIGAGIWAEYDYNRDAILLTTEERVDGTKTTNTIVLEASEWNALRLFAKRSIEM